MTKRQGFSTEATLKGAIKASRISHANRIAANDFAAVAVDKGRDAQLYAGLSFSDDPRAARWEPRWTKLPDLRHTPSGNGTAMCASARRT